MQNVASVYLFEYAYHDHTRPRGYKKFMLNPAKHEIFPALKC